MNPLDILWIKVERLIGREALYLDQADWDAWLNLYTEAAEFWVPAWDDNGELTANPSEELSLIYYSNRAGLEDRVYRIRTRRSSASTPLPRTCHIFQLLEVGQDDRGITARANWMVHSCREGTTTTYYGGAEYEFVTQGEHLAISRKKVTVVNDVLETLLDIYSI